MRTGLRYYVSPSANLSATGYGIYRFQPTGAFDIDPSIGGTVPPGFAEMALLYNSYRVKGSRITVEASNTAPAQAVQLTVFPTNVDPGASPSGTFITSARENPYAISKMCAPVGGQAVKIVTNMSTQKMFGNPMTNYDDNFSALVNAIPVNNWYWIIVFYSPATIASTYPFLMSVLIEVDIEFYDRKFLFRT